MLEDIIYTKRVQYNRKGKWRNCQLQIEIIRRCQDKLMAIISGVNDKVWSNKFSIYGYECSNYFVSLIGKNVIHRIKLESLEKVQILTEILEKYMKDVSFKFQLTCCSSSQDVLIVSQWYMLHVQTNRVCLTTDEGNRLITKWNRSEIGQYYIENSTLNIQIHSKNENLKTIEKILYTFFRVEKFALEKIYKAIENLKFELTLPRQEKLPSTRRSNSIDFRRVSTWGNTKERITRERTSYSFRTCDFTNDESSSSSTPCSPKSVSLINDQFKDYSHIDEEVGEAEDLIFEIDTTESQSNEYKEVDYQDSNVPVPSNVSTNHKLVHLERCPYESERRSQGKRSPEHMIQVSPAHTTINIANLNVNEQFINTSCYQTMNSIEHNRKTCSETNFSSSTGQRKTKGDSIDSLETRPCSPDKISQCSSPLIFLSSSSSNNNCSRTIASLKKTSNGDYFDSNNLRRLAARRTSYSDSNHNYYNIKTALEVNHSPSRPNSTNDNRQSHLLSSSTHNYYNVSGEDDQSSIRVAVTPDKVAILNYSEICFPDTNNYGKTVANRLSERNYKDIDIKGTEALKEVDDNIVHNIANNAQKCLPKRGKRNILKLFKK